MIRQAFADDSRLTMDKVQVADELQATGEEDMYDFSYYWADPCNEFAHSVIFFLMVSVAWLGWILFVFASIRTQTLHKSGTYILLALLFASSAIRYGPKIWGALQVHGFFHYSQSGCKLVAFTEYGLRHVNSALLILLTVLAWMKLYRPALDLDCMIQANLPWLLLGLFVVEGVSGIVPAIYTDLDPDVDRCNFANVQDTSTTEMEFLVAQLLLSTIIPYILPFVSLMYPLIRMTRSLVVAEAVDNQTRRTVTLVVLLLWTNIMLSLPWALHAVVMLPLLQAGDEDFHNTRLVCVMDGFFRMMLECWSALAPFLVLHCDPLLKVQIPCIGHVETGLARLLGLAKAAGQAVARRLK